MEKTKELFFKNLKEDTFFARITHIKAEMEFKQKIACFSQVTALNK